MTGLVWGIFGTGVIAGHFAADLLKVGLTVAAVGSRSLDSAAEFAHRFGLPRSYGSYEDLVSDPAIDAVYVATPHSTHAELALLAIAHGKHVLVEKPIAINAVQALKIQEAARTAQVVVVEAMWTRFLPHMRRVRGLAQSGQLGEIRGVTAEVAFRISTDPNHRINRPDLGGGALLDLGVYAVALGIQLLGTIRDVTAVAHLSDTQVDSDIALALASTNGAVLSAFASSRVTGSNSAQILGTESRVEIGATWFEPSSLRIVQATGNTLVESFEIPAGVRGMHFQVNAMERIVEGEPEPDDPTGLDDAIAAMQIMDQIRRQISVVYPADRPMGDQGD